MSGNHGGQFAGKVAFITGAARGFGLAFSQALHRRGAKVVLADVDEAEARRQAAALGGGALATSCNVADEQAVAAAVALSQREFGGIDILINNAGLHSSRYNVPFADLGPAETRRLWEVNVMGVVNCSLACRDSMAERGGGAIVNIASAAAYKTTTPYGVSKLAVRGLTMAFAHEFAEAKVRVNAISPGLIATETILRELPELFDEYLEKHQLVKRTGKEADIVAMAMFLLSDEAGFITGETFKVTGGHVLHIS